MTTYFTAPDGHGELTLWVRDPDLRDPLPIIRQCDLGGMAHHWDELVARVIAGNLSATEQWALDKAARTGLPSRAELTEEESDEFTAALQWDTP